MPARPTKPRTDDGAYLVRYGSLVSRLMRLADKVAVRKILRALARRPYELPLLLVAQPNGKGLAQELRQLAKERGRQTLGARELDRRVRGLVREQLSTLGGSAGATTARAALEQSRERVRKVARGKTTVRTTPVGRAKSGRREGRGGDAASAERGDSSVSVVLERDIVVKRPIEFKRPPSPLPGGPPGGLLSSRPLASAAPTGGSGTPPRSQAKPPRRPGGLDGRPPARWVNAEIEDHPPSEPLEPDTTYTIAFGVDITQQASAVATTEFADTLVFPKGVKEVSLTVQLYSDDFDIPDPTRPLRVPRTGQSRGKARFDITPRHVGRCSLKATLHKDRNFVQQLEITLSVGRAKAKPVEVEATGRPPNAAVVLQPRDIGLSIEPAAGEGYDCTVRDSVAAKAHLPIKQGELTSAVEALQAALLKVVNQQDDAGAFIFQTSVDIPEASATTALRALAKAGALLFQSLFFHPAAGADAQRLGTWLRDRATDPESRLTIQIVALTTPIPWDLLYIGDASDAAVPDWDLFLGMRHIVEQIPLQNTLSIADYRIPSDKPSLAVSVNLNGTIDTQFGVSYVKNQEQYWQRVAQTQRQVRVTPRTTSQEVMKALGEATTEDQIVYFYCHASTAGIGPGSGGPNASTIELTDGEMSLGDFKLNAPMSVQLRGMPLVFINACESAELSPAFYDGFVPYFMAKGARGVVGTECQMPALFAAEWHDRFFDRFLGGTPIGEIVLALRREFRSTHNNPLGLLYAVHCDADTQVRPALAAAAAS